MENEDKEAIPSEEQLLKRHRQEKKDLQAKIQALKKTATKGDKKKKKEVAESIANLEQELNDKHAAELNELVVSDIVDEDLPVNNDENIETESQEQTNKITRAQKRRNKKQTSDREREKRIAEQEEVNKQGPRVVELNTIKEILVKEGLDIFNIPADGNCLYCAIGHQLEVTKRDSPTINELRKLTADYIRENKDECLPFMCNDDDETLDELNFEKYCKDVATTKLWGGQLELMALSNVLKCPIKIIQASGPSTVQGESFNGEPLILTYHKHLYRLGEHYNSTVKCKSIDDTES